MIRKRTALLGGAVLLAGLTVPLAASADDNALAFVIGAAVGQAFDADHVRYVHVRHRQPHPGYRHSVHRRIHGWHQWDHRWQHLKWRHDRRNDWWDDRRDRRHDRHERRHDRHDRRHDRHDRRHDGRDGRRDRD